MPLCAEWTDVDTVLDCCSVDPAADIERSITIASEILYELSGRRWSGGQCSATIRPCQDCIPDEWGSGTCNPSRVDFGHRHVTAITEVRIDGVVIAASGYRLDHNRYLTRLGDESWPCTQDLSASDGEENTFAIDVVFGAAPPTAGVHAASIFACELAKQCSPSTSDTRSCRLPARVTGITRQGVSMDRSGEITISETLTGLPEVDLWLQTVNPSRLKRPPKIASPNHKRDLTLI